MAATETLWWLCTHRRARPVGRRVCFAFLCAAIHLLASRSIHADSLTEHFTGPTPSWQVKSTDKSVRTMTHRRSPEHGSDGPGEFVAVEADREGQKIGLEYALPRARVLNELEAVVWVKSLRPGAQLHLRVVLPEFVDESTGRPLSLLIPGDVLEESDSWQRLTCRTDDKLVQERLVLLRARLRRKDVTPKILQAERLVLTWPLSPGVNEISLDELTFGPLVKLKDAEAAAASHEQETPDDPPVTNRLDRLEIEGKPFFPRIIPYHGQPLKDLAGTGFNVVWVPDYTDTSLLAAVRRENMWVTAMPPVAVGSDHESASLSDAGLMPFGTETRSIAFWMLGTRISAATQPQLLKWVDQIQAADRKYRRPLAADVNGEENIFSRELDLLGLSRHTMGTSLSLTDYRNWLATRRTSARPGNLCWTWIQVVPSPTVSAAWDHRRIPLQLEPEQIRLQVYAALAAGMRGIGFWTPRALSEENPADRETLLALQQINRELWLLEPWLATSNGVSLIPVSLETEGKSSVKPKLQFGKSKKEQLEGQSQLFPYDARPQPQTDSDTKETARAAQDLSAAVLRTDTGVLLLPMWLEEHAQFVPGQLAAPKVSMIVPGIHETAIAWEISSTGVHSLEREKGNGGVKISLRNFDQTACILITSDRELIDDVRRRVATIEEQSARTCLTLAELKLERVRATDQRLGELGLRQPEAPQILGRASMLYTEGREALSRRDWQRVRLRSQQALQMARLLQRKHWDDAVRDLPSPVASPFAVGFQSLPVQAKFATQVPDHRTNAAPNLLPSGGFEDVETLTAVGWKHEQHELTSIRADAELSPHPRHGKYCLRMFATPNSAPLAASPPAGQEYVTVATPPLTVHAGHALRISGWIKIPQTLAGSPDGVLVYESLSGRSLALRFREKSGWQRFELVREVVESQDVVVTVALTALGEVYLDDLEVTVQPLSELAQASAKEYSRPRPAPDQSRWSDLRRFNPLPIRPPRGK